MVSLIRQMTSELVVLLTKTIKNGSIATHKICRNGKLLILIKVPQSTTFYRVIKGNRINPLSSYSTAPHPHQVQMMDMSMTDITTTNLSCNPLETLSTVLMVRLIRIRGIDRGKRFSRWRVYLIR